ncbi:hypothetical protein, partial [Rhizobium sp. SSA_523]|uniref:hypothetical protein n=1 Tax=Rhizobium sp. SSA_523 TaxID=2952477 RepID=UPI00209042FF
LAQPGRVSSEPRPELMKQSNFLSAPPPGHFSVKINDRHLDQKTNLPLLQRADHENWNDKIGDEDLELSSALSAAVHAQRYP